MKLSDYKNEEAIDVLADVMGPVVIIANDLEFQKRWNSGKPIVYALQYALKNYKKEVVQLVATLHREDPETYEFTIPTLLTDLIELINDPLIQAVFPVQGQNIGSESSGSAMGNIVGEA